MTHDWILAVLCDLRRFAAQNAMPELAAGLDETIRLAEAELGAVPMRRPEAEDDPPARCN